MASQQAANQNQSFPMQTLDFTRSHCRGWTVWPITRHGIDICFQQESPCSRRHGLTTKHVSGLGCRSVLNGYTQCHAPAGRLYTTRDDLTLVPIAVKRTFAFLLHKPLCPCPVVFRRPSLQARQPREDFLVTSVSILSKQAPTTCR